MLREFVRLASISGILFTLTLFFILLILGWAYRDRLVSVFLDGLGNELEAEIRFERVRLDLVRHFPRGSLELHGLELARDVEDPKGGASLQTHLMQLHFSLADLLRGNYTLRELSLSGGSIMISRNGNHEAARQPVRLPGTEKAAAAEAGFSIDIRRIRLKDMAFSMLDEESRLLVQADIEGLDLQGRILDPQPALSARGILHLVELEVGGSSVPGAKLHADLFMNFLGDERLRLQEARMEWNGQSFSLDALVDWSGDRPWLHLELSGHNLDAETILADMPWQWRQSVMGYQPRGQCSFDATLKGYLGDGSSPAIHCSFSWRGGGIRDPESGKSVAITQLSGSYSNGAQRNASSSELRIKDFTGHMAGGRLEGNLHWKNFRQPSLAFNLQALLDAEDLLAWHPVEGVTQARGQIKLNLAFAGRMSGGREFSHSDLLAAEISGHVAFDHLHFVLNDNHLLPYNDFRGTLLFDDSSLEIRQLMGQAGESDFSLVGRMDNVLPYLFLPDQSIVVRAGLESSYINLDELLKDGDSKASETYRLRLPRRLRLQLDAGIDKLRFRRFTASKVEGSTRLENQRLFADHLVFHTMGGRVFMHGQVDGRTAGQLYSQCQAQLIDVDIHQLFYQTGNFGQQDLIHENIHGTVDADLFFSAHWDDRLNICWESMETTARLKVENGRLVNYQPMITLSDFLRTSDLSDVSFSTLENEVHIKDRLILIPDMTIQSSALDLQLSGRHSFDNEVDYRLQVLLSDLLGSQHRSRRNPQEQYGEIMDDGLGRTTLFLKITGTTREPVLGYDYAGVRDKLRDDLREERRNLANILREEFSFLSRPGRDSLPPDTANGDRPEREKERQILQKQEEGHFVIEWEEFDF